MDFGVFAAQVAGGAHGALAAVVGGRGVVPERGQFAFQLVDALDEAGDGFGDRIGQHVVIEVDAVVAPTTASTRPAPHSSEPAPITATGPKRVTTASVRKRPTAIVAANTANAMPATLSLACKP